MLDRRALSAIVGFSGLACGGLAEPPPPPPGCGPLEVAAGPPVTSLARHLREAPPWAAEWNTPRAPTVHGSGGGRGPARALPQLEGAADRVTGGTGAPDGGPLVCRVDLPERGLRTVNLEFAGGGMVAAVDEWPVLERFGISVPGVSGGTELRVRGAVVRTECSGFEPFFLLVGGFPIPKCATKEGPTFDDAVTWSGGYEGVRFRCEAIPWAVASRRADEALARFSADVAAACRSRDEPATYTMQRDAARSEAWEAAAWVGWADPRVIAATRRLAESVR